MFTSRKRTGSCLLCAHQPGHVVRELQNLRSFQHPAPGTAAWFRQHESRLPVNCEGYICPARQIKRTAAYVMTSGPNAFMTKTGLGLATLNSMSTASINQALPLPWCQTEKRLLSQVSGSTREAPFRLERRIEFQSRSSSYWHFTHNDVDRNICH